MWQSCQVKCAIKQSYVTCITHWPLGDVAVILNKINYFQAHYRDSILSPQCEITLGWMPQCFMNEKSTMVQVMAWCHQATCHYLSECWSRPMLPCAIPRPQWVKLSHMLTAHNQDLCWHETRGSSTPSQCPKRRLFVRSREVSKARDWYFKLSYRFEIWQAHRQQCCRSACQMSERSDNSEHKSRGS